MATRLSAFSGHYAGNIEISGRPQNALENISKSWTVVGIYEYECVLHAYDTEIVMVYGVCVEAKETRLYCKIPYPEL